MTPPPAAAAPFDLPAYIARIGLDTPPAADVAGLMQVQRAQRMTIPFENLDVRLGRGIAVDPASVFAKLVGTRRGGYCFEHNLLFAGALRALGFVVRPLLARVWLGAPWPAGDAGTNGDAVPARTHMLLHVDTPDGPWIADAGFGGAYTPPMPLADGVQATSPDGAVHRLARDPGHGWLLTREGDPDGTDGRGAGEGIVPQYSFTTDPVWFADIAQANHHISTVPAHRFTTVAIVSIVLPRGFATLTDRQYRRRNGTETVTAEIASARAYRLRLSLVFGIDLTMAEVETLGLF